MRPRGVCKGHEDEFNGRERYLNGQVVRARVNEAGLDVTEDDGRGGRSTQQNDRDEKVMGKRDCDEFEEWDDDQLPHTQKHHNYYFIATSIVFKCLEIS